MARDTEINQKWKNEEKSYIRTTILQEAMEYLEDEAFKEYRYDRSGLGKKLSELILIARDCAEKQKKKE